MPLRWMWISRTAAAVALQRGIDRLRGRSLAERDRRSGRRIAEALGRRGGLYAKLGQYLALRADLLSSQLRAELATLEERAPAREFHEIYAPLQAALGPAARRFAWIDPEPLATASIAQVHRAKLEDGPQVTIKLRHRELDPQRLARDLRALRRASRLFRRWVRRRDLRALLAALGQALSEELDFEKEAQVAEAIAANFEDDPRIVVPGVHWEASGPGVLTLDYVPRVRLDDHRRLEQLGIAPEDCLALLCEAYGRQVLEHGLFHADPHPGNVFVVDEADRSAPAGTEQPRILFLDFGLAHRLPDGMRAELRLGLQALLLGDVGALMGCLERIGALRPGRRRRAERAIRQVLEAGGEALEANASAIESLTRLGRGLVRESGAFRVPPELLLYAKTLLYVLALARSLAPGVDPMPRLLPHVMKFLSSPP